jgi:DNA-binding transcriptional LysR family regulator
LRYVTVLAETQSFTKAAKSLYISQPHLSQSIKAFEDSINITIFDRSTYPIKVTPAGEYIVEWGNRLISDEKNALGLAKLVSNGTKSQLTIVSSRLRNITYLPRVICKFQSIMPECKIILKTAVSIELREKMFTDRETDILLDMVPYQTSGNMISKHLLKERTVLAVPASHPLAPRYGGISTVNLADFAGHKFVSYLPFMRLHNILMDVCTQNGFLPNIVLEVPDSPTACAAVAAGIGVSIVPNVVAREGYLSDRICYCNISGQDEAYDIFISYYSDREKDKDMTLMIRLLEEDALNTGTT